MFGNTSHREPIEEVAEQFLDRLRRGEPASIEEYAGRFPELADEIRDLFPALQVLEKVGGRQEQNTSPTPGPPRRLGEYRLLRELGRGGMGVVYEAIQESLGRRVALKLLNQDADRDGTRLLRFHREARAAANLHHTNIVPVFDTGCHDGVHFYAMQFIEGHNLDTVLSELRAGLLARDAASTDAISRSAAPSTDGALEPPNKHPSASQSPQPVAIEQTESFDEATPTSEDAASPSDPPFESGGLVNRRDGARGAGSESSLSAISSDYDSRYRYYRSAARIVLQLTEALAYAHDQGVLHRDIKPSNLILDDHGTVWVADFGLAKYGTGDLTHTGDVVGTLRYMSPERFRGQADARSDLYSAGLTLYELLTLTPAFSEPNRARLVDSLLHREPPRPRKIEPRIPKDLETIVLKAIDKDPGRRYRSADAMATDLRLFLADRPIQARRTSPLEHTWRWCRRNPLLATLCGLIAGLVLATGLGFGYLEAEAANRANLRAYAALRVGGRASRLSHAAGQRTDSLEALTEAVALLPSLRWSRERKLAERRELINEVAATAALSDFRQVRKLPDLPVGARLLAVCPDADRYAWSAADGVVHVASLNANQTLAKLDLPAVLHAAKQNENDQATDGEQAAGVPAQPDSPVWTVRDARFAAGGRLLAIKAICGDRGMLQLWDIRKRQATHAFPITVGGQAFDFAPTGDHIAVGADNEGVHVYSVESGKRLLTHARDLLTRGRVTGTATPHTVRYSPDGRKIAVSYGTIRIDLFVATRAGRPQVIQHSLTMAAVHGVAWSPDSRELAAAGRDGRIYVWDANRILGRRELVGHDAPVDDLSFSPTGNYLASWGADGRIWFWDARSGSPILYVPGSRAVIQSDGKRFWYAVPRNNAGWSVKQGELVDDGELLVLRQRPLFGRNAAPGPTCLDIGYDDRLLVSAHADGFRGWDLKTGKLLYDASGTQQPMSHVLFAPNGRQLIMTGTPTKLIRRGVFHCRVLDKTFARAMAAPKFDPARQVPCQFSVNATIDKRPGGFTALSADGKCLAVAITDGDHEVVQIYDAAYGKKVTFTPRVTIRPTPERPDTRNSPLRIGVSHDGRWVACGSAGERITIWNARTGKLERTLGRESAGAHFVFDPTGQWLATSSADVIRLWDLNTWSPIHTIPRAADVTGGGGRLAFSRDGRLLALANDHRSLKIVATDSLAELVELRPPEPKQITWLGFSRDSGRLVVATDAHIIQIWNLRALQRTLRRVGLELDSLPAQFPPEDDRELVYLGRGIRAVIPTRAFRP